MTENAVSNASNDWTEQRFDTTPFDLQHYLEKRRSQNEDYLVCMNDLLTTISEYWDEGQHRKLAVEVPWLVGFITDDGDLGPACAALAASPNLCTRLVLRINLLLSNWTIVSEWKTQALATLKSWNWEEEKWFVDGDYSPTKVSSVIRCQIERKHIVIHSLWNERQQSADNYTKSKDFQPFASKVAQFCLEAGCPAVKHHPVKDIYSLRHHLFSRGSEAREAELQKEIEELRSANRCQQRIITNLAFRHLLEILPSRGTKSTSATAKWRGFFQHALKTAQEHDGRSQTAHPLIPVLKKYPPPKRVEDVGINLYSTLSTNIHHFTGQFKILDDQWNILEADILRALTPLDENETGTGIDWERERQRY
jgi:hypothetical protein